MAGGVQTGSEVFDGEDRALLTAGTTQVKPAAGRAYRCLIGAVIPTSIDLYDDAAANNNRVWSRSTFTVGDIFELDCPMEAGIRVVIVGASSEVTLVFT